MSNGCGLQSTSGSPDVIPSSDLVEVLSETSTSKNYGLGCPGSKSRMHTHHRRSKSDVFCDVPVVPKHFRDSASVYSTENRSPYRSCDLSSQSSSTAASPPRSSCSYYFRNFAVVDKFAHLHSQVLSFVAKVSVTESGSLARAKVIQTIQDVVRQVDSDIRVEPFGSFCTGLSLNSSDVDVVLTCASHSPSANLSSSRPCLEAHSASRSSSPSSVQCKSGFECKALENQDQSAPFEETLEPGVSDFSAGESAAQLNWWEIPPPDIGHEIAPELGELSTPELGWEHPPPESERDSNLEDSVSVVSHETVLCSSALALSDRPLHNGTSFSFDDLPEQLKACPRISNVRYIKTARIPIIKLLVTHDVPGVDAVSVDITSALKYPVPDAPSQPALVHSGICVREFVKLALQDYPSIKPLVMIMKVVLSKRGLSNPYRGGLGSYPLFIMVYYWTRFRNQSSENIKLGREGEDGALGRILMEFLSWVASMFPWETSVLDWAPSELQVGHFCPVTTPRLDLTVGADVTKAMLSSAVVIMDPLNPGANVAAVSTQFASHSSL
jgi:hypothetical protein